MQQYCDTARFRKPGIDSEESIPLAYVAWRAGTTNRVVASARDAVIRFLDSLKVLQIRARLCAVKSTTVQCTLMYEYL
jgi:hypothetical protein